MKTFDAFRIVSADNHSTLAFVWWDGARIRSTSKTVLEELKNTFIGSLSYEDGESFFNVIPRRYSSGYMYTRKARVDREGNEV
ncbi:MAG: hypothetical protein EBS53_00440 [Bacteroidetes bacterium]|jgi:hypothetical protein|nr:hypothetical protein [Bacteroidota bacterium]